MTVWYLRQLPAELRRWGVGAVVRNVGFCLRDDYDTLFHTSVEINWI